MSPLVFQNSEIECKTDVKYLGVIFDENMSWEKQANRVRSKAYLGLNKIRRISHLVDNSTKNLLVNALVFPHLNYCLNSWSKLSAAALRKFDSLSRQINQIHPINKGFRQLCDYSSALMTFKAINNLAPQYICDRVNLVRSIHDHYTRLAAQNNLAQRQNRNRFEAKTFANSAIPIWNNLPRECLSYRSKLVLENTFSFKF